MAGFGPPPKPDDQRRRTNATVAMTKLPFDGYEGPIPDWPFDSYSDRELRRWERLWRTPQAAAWVPMHIEYVVARYVRCCIQIEADWLADDDGGKGAHRALSVATTNLHAEARQLEDRLGLSPQAMLRLRWEVVREESASVTPMTPKRRLKAVDPEAG